MFFSQCWNTEGKRNFKRIKMKKKAIYFYQYLPPWRIDVFNEMAKMYDLTIVFFNYDREGFTYDRDSLLKKLKNVDTVFLNKGFRIGSRPVRFGIFDLLKKHTPDVVFAHEYSPVSIAVALFRMLHKSDFKYILTTSDNLQMAELSSGLKRWSRTFVLNHSDGVIVYSRDVREFYRKAYPKIKTGICPNIQNPDSLLDLRKNFATIIERYKELFNLKDSKIILYIGRLNKVKGLDLLLRAFSKTEDNDYKIVFVGNGAEETALKSLAVTLGIEDRVVFAGFYSGIDLYAWYDIANFFILPSTYEPFGAVVNEALVYGCPVVASKYIGALDFIDESNGFVFDPLNETEYPKVLNIAMNRYSKVSSDRKNMMIRSFNDYVDIFGTIVD